MPAYRSTIPHLPVEYDESYWGGDYSGSGDTAYVPLPLIEQVGVEEAFRQAKGVDPIHIIHYTENGDCYTADGVEWPGYGYRETFPVQQQQILEYRVAQAILLKSSPIPGMRKALSEQDCQELAEEILMDIISELRPDLVQEEES